MKKQLLILALLLGATFLRAQVPDLNACFQSAAVQYNVPVDVLKAVAYAETKFYHHIPDSPVGHNGKPAAYGIMGLRNDGWFGYSLKTGAALINRTEEEVINDVRLNILAGAAYLASIAERRKEINSDINSWRYVLEEYSGIPQVQVKEFYSFDVFHALKNGVENNGVELMPHPEVRMEQFSETVNPVNKLKNIESDDYPSAVWSPSQNFTTNGISQKFAVVHDTEGGFAGSVSWLQNPAASASAHYVIRSSDGYIVQLVLEANRAWHVSCWNSHMLGVEHEGYVANPAYFTDAMYISSAALFRHFCTKFNIPFSRNRIIGHNEWQNATWKSWMATNYSTINTGCNTHTDPGKYWDWGFYMQLISQDSTRPSVVSYSPVSTAPADSFPLNSLIKITFNQKMKAAQAQAAFSITPSVVGSFYWENNRTMVFKPLLPLANNTVYTVNLTSAPVNYLNGALTAPVSFSFKTQVYNALELSNAYPAAGQGNVIKNMRAIIRFNVALDQSTISSNIGLKDSSGKIVALKSIRYAEEGNQGVVYITPKLPLEGDKNYSVVIMRNLKNSSGVAIGRDSVYQFRTANKDYSLGTVLDSVEVIGNWKDPGFSGSTVGVDPAQSKFSITNEEVFYGSNAAKITYVFTAADGVARTFNASKPNVGSLATRRAGFWINGDASNNFLEYWFYYNSSTNVIVPVDTLNWSGWKLVDVPLSSVAGTGDRLLHSITIRHSPMGAASGAIYADALQINDESGTEPLPGRILPTSFALEQNYPNPFNPSTIIRYSIPSEGKVTLKIYDVLGNEIRTLVNEIMPAGTYATTFDAASGNRTLTSGMYLYVLSTPQGTRSGKMLLLK